MIKTFALLAFLFSFCSFAAAPAEELTRCISGKWQGKGQIADSLTGKFAECTLNVNIKSVNATKVAVAWNFECPQVVHAFAEELSLENDFRLDPTDENYRLGSWDFTGIKRNDQANKFSFDLRANHAGADKCSVLTLKTSSDWERDYEAFIGSARRVNAAQ